MLNQLLTLLEKSSLFQFFMIDSFHNDDDFLLVFLVMGILFFLIALVIGIVLSLIFIGLVFFLVGGGIISASVLVGLKQKSLSKGFKTFFMAVAILGNVIICTLLFWFLNGINHWVDRDTAIISGLISGIFTGWLLGLLLFHTTRKFALFFKNKYDLKKPF